VRTKRVDPTGIVHVNVLAKVIDAGKIVMGQSRILKH
jgi:hypothetical protein